MYLFIYVDIRFKERKLLRKRDNSVSLGVAIVTLNEEEMISGCLDSISWAPECLVVDSGSHDNTVFLAQKGGAKVLHKPWIGYADQKNFAMDQLCKEWILILDADERVTTELADEIRELIRNWRKGHPEGFLIPFRQHVLNRRLHYGGWGKEYFILRLFRRGLGRYKSQGVHERLDFQGTLGKLRSPIVHYPYRTISQMIQKQYRYASLEASELLKQGHRPVAARDFILRPIRYWIHRYLFLMGFLDGTPGLVVASMHAFCRFLVMVRLWELQRNLASTERGSKDTLSG